MAATLNFPTNPTLNQTYSFGGKTWVWNGQGWQLSASGAINNIPIGNITPAAGTFTALSATGNVSGSYFIGNGRFLTGIATGTTYSNTNVASYLPVYTGNLVSLTGPVITTANVTGNYIFGNGSQLTGLPATYSNANVAAYLPTYSGNLASLTGPVTTTGNITGGNIRTSGTISASGNITGNVVSAALISSSGNIVSSGGIFIGNGAGLTGVIATGNVGSAQQVANGVTSINIPISDGNIIGNVGGVFNLFNFTPLGFSIAGNIVAASNVTSGNILTGGVVSAAGTITGSSLLGSVVSASANVIGGNLVTAGLVSASGTVTGSSIIGSVVSASANVTGGNILTSGLVSASGTITGSSIIGSVVSASANVTGGNLVTAGLVSATGNVSGNYILGNGALLTGVITSVANINNGTSNVTVVSSGGNVTVGIGGTGNIAVFSSTGEYVTGVVSASGNIIGGNIVTSGTGGNITGANVVSATTLSATANVISGNVSTTGLITAAGNVTGGNLRTAGLVSATGNIAGAYFIGNGSQLTGIASGTPLTVSQYTTGNISNAISNVSALRFDTTTGFSVTDLGNNSALVSLGSSFKTWEVSGQANLVAVGEDVVEFVAGNGMSITTNALSTPQQIKFTATYGNSNVTTLLSNLGSNVVSTTGNITGSYFIGNGSQLTGIVTSSSVISNGTSNVDVVSSGGNVTVGIGGTGNVIVWATTGEYVTGVVSASGNVTGGNIRTAGLVSATGTVTGSSLLGSVVSASANVTGGNVLTGGLVSATGTVTGSSILGSVLSVTANVTGGNLLTSGLASITGSATVGNVLTSGLISASGNATVGNLQTVGQISATGNVTGGNLATTGSFSVSGNAASGNIQTTGQISASGTVTSGNLVTSGLISSTGNITSGNVQTAGLITATGNITGGNVKTAGVISATGNISGGNLSIAGNIDTGNVTTGGLSLSGFVYTDVIPVSNITLSLGNTTNRWKDLWLSGNTIILGDANLSTQGSDFSVSGNITTPSTLFANAASITGNLSPGNLLTEGLISANGTITGSTLIGSVISASANIIAGNILTGGLFSSAGNITGANLLINNDATITGNLVVNGNTTFINSNVITTNDKSITLANNQSTAANVDGAGIDIGGTTIAYWRFNNATTSWQSNIGITPVSNAVLNLGGTSNYWGTIYANTLMAPTVSATSNVVAGNILTGGIVSATGNITSASNIAGGNLLISGLISATANLVAANLNAVGLSLSGSVLSPLDVTGNISGGNIQTNGLITAGGNVIGGNVLTGGLISSSGNVTGGNIRTAGIVSATSTITGGNLATGGTASAGGNITGANILTSGLISAASNISGSYFIGNGSQLTGVTATTTAISNGSSNVSVVAAGSNVTVGIGGTGNIAVFATTGEYVTGVISATGNISGNYFIGNGSLLTGISGSGGVGNTITLGTPTDGNLTGNVAYSGWTTGTYVTDGLDDLNQVTLNVAGNTFVGNTYITANTYAGPSPLSVSFTGRYIGNPNSYLWQFGDGTANVTTANATHTFSNTLGGTYTITYTAYNTGGTYSGNAALGAKGSTSTATIANIVVYTPTPVPGFTLSSNSINTGNQITIGNNSSYVTWYDLSFGDGTANFTSGPGLANTSWSNVNHTYNAASANTDSLYSVRLTGTSNTAGASNVSVTTAANAAGNVKVYSSMAGNVFVTANVTTVINGLGTISFRNDSNGSPGNTASFGGQQYYYFSYGDGNISNVVIATGTAGNPSAANVTNTFILSAGNQAGNAYQQFTANLYLYTGFSSSPAKSSNITITVEPQVRANFIGTAANVTTDATANTGNAQVGYIYTDYNGNNRATFTFQNTSQNSNLANWSWGDSTFSNGVSNVGNVLHTYTTTGAKTVALTANGTPNGISSTAQSNTLSTTGYIFIAANPTAPTNLSGFSNLAILNASEGTSPLLAAGARDATDGNIVANGTSVTRFATTTTIATAANIVNANTATTGTLNAYVNNNISGNVTFTTNGNTVGSNAALVITQDRDLHVANAAVPSYFYKVFNANISCALSSLGTGYNNYKMVHTVSGNTNYVGFVKDNLNTAPSLVTSNVVMVEGTAGTYRYISGIPYYNTGSPTVTVANLEVANLSGQTFRSADPFTLDSGTLYEGSGALVTATQTKALSTINNSGNSFLTGANLNANIGVSSNYTLGNLTANITGANNTVATFQANIFNVVGTGATVQLPTKIQTYAGANSGVNEQSITASTTGNTQAAVRIVMSTSGNTPAFSDSTNFYTANVWSGAQTIAGTPEAVVRYGVLKHYAVDLSTGYLPVGPNLSSGRSGTQYFTFAFARPSLANFDIRITSSTGVAGVWIAAPGTTIDKSGFSSPTPGFPGPTSTISGWLEGFTQYAGSGVPGASGTGGNGSNGCALTGADVIPLNTAISNVAYTMTLGAQNAANSTGNNILIRIALASGQTITDLQIGTAT